MRAGRSVSHHPRKGFTVFWCLRSLLFGSPGAGGKGRTGRLREGQRRSRPVARLSGRLRQSGRCPRARRGCPAVPSLLPGRISGPLLLLAPLRHGGAALGCGDRRWHLRHQPEGTGCSKHSAWGGGEAGKGHILVCTRSPTYLGSPALSWGWCGGCRCLSLPEPRSRCWLCSAVFPGCVQGSPLARERARAASHPALPPPAPGRGGSWVASDLAIRAGNAGSAVRFDSSAVAVPSRIQG